jgi:acyl-CoA synthetase (AMP-forming)/AMP-acid ligase II
MKKFRTAREPVVAIPFLMLDHFGGINTILAITASLGTVVTAENRSITTICEAIQAHKVDLLPTTPSFLTLLAATDLSSKYDLSSLKRITYGTETMPQATLDRIRTRFPAAELLVAVPSMLLCDSNFLLGLIIFFHHNQIYSYLINNIYICR